MPAEFGKCLDDAGLPPERVAHLASFQIRFNEGIRVTYRRNVSREQLHCDIDMALHRLQSEKMERSSSS
jgi:hypothetical protein